MKTVRMSISRVRAMDLLYGEETRPFIQGVRLSTLEDGDNAEEQLAMSYLLKVDLNELCAYIWLQTWRKELGEPGSPSVQKAAQKLGISLADLEEYLQEQNELSGSEGFVYDESFIGSSRAATPWDTLANRLIDLQQDAGNLATAGFREGNLLR